MEEILFRGKRVDDGEWVEGDLLKSDEHCFIVPIMGISCVEEYKHANTNKFIQLYAYDVAPETVCWYTGLTDKKGRKIFEGDIAQEYPFKAIVRFGEFENQVFKNIGFNLDWSNAVSYRQDLPYWVDKIEVIGNIFDNPELLKGA